jgi:hypothetical protein
MKLYKLAQGKMVKVKVTIDYKTGTIDARVVDNPNGENCHGDANANLLKDLLEAEIPDYGAVEVTDSGLTEEGFAHRNKDRTKPSKLNPLKGPKTPVPTPGAPMPQQPIPEGQLDTGFGV